MTPVKLPSSAPEPTKLPAQPRATGTGADLVIRTIPRSVWNDMNGISWRSGCPVGRWSLRLVRVNYWAFDGYRRRGEIVVHEDAARKVGKAFPSRDRSDERRVGTECGSKGRSRWGQCH